jgi:hypothetical protein
MIQGCALRKGILCPLAVKSSVEVPLPVGNDSRMRPRIATVSLPDLLPTRWSLLLCPAVEPIRPKASTRRAGFGWHLPNESSARVGFSVAAATTHDGAISDGDQVGSLTASLITHAVREPLQLWNFGHVVDRVGDWGAAWSVAVRAGAPSGPITAMKARGDRAAVLCAEQLDGTNVWAGAALVFAAGLLARHVTQDSQSSRYRRVCWLPHFGHGGPSSRPRTRSSLTALMTFRPILPMPRGFSILPPPLR